MAALFAYHSGLQRIAPTERRIEKHLPISIGALNAHRFMTEPISWNSLLTVPLLLFGIFLSGCVGTDIAPPTGVSPNSVPPVRTPVTRDLPTIAYPPNTMPDWEHATLDQVQFREAKVILKQNAQIKIWSWLPDNRRLLVELRDPQAQEQESRFRILTLDVQTGEIMEYGRRSDDSRPPLWIEQNSSIAFSYWNVKQGMRSELHLGHPNEKVEVLATDISGMSVQPLTASIFYLLSGEASNPLRVIDVNQISRGAQVSFPIPVIPNGRPLIDARGKYLAILRGSTLPVLDLDSGGVDTYGFSGDSESGLAFIIDGVWSPNNPALGLVVGKRDFPGGLVVQDELYIIRPLTKQQQNIELPVPYFSEFEWSPAGHFLLVKGQRDTESRVVYVLVDSSTNRAIELSYFPAVQDNGETGMAWSPLGTLAWVKNVPEGLGIAITQVSIRK